MSDIDREISNTTRWGVSLLLGLLVQSVAVFWWAAQLDSQVNENTKDITSLETKVENINDDIRSILVGIEQVKARLGIVESEPGR
jgi:peptidoglycan hydrolase CwlO-like protein